MHKIVAAAIIILACVAAGRENSDRRTPAQEKYELKENVAAGRKTRFAETRVSSMKVQTQLNGEVVENKDSTERMIRQGTETVLTVVDGIPTAARFDMDATCGTIITAPGENAKQETSPFAGKSITLRRKLADSVSDDFHGEADAEAIKDLHSLLDPDADDLPDHPVAIGESWEISAKAARHMDLAKNEHMLAFCRLDWVKEIGGRKTAQLSISAAFIQHIEEFIEQDVELSGTELLDMETGTVVRADVKGIVKLSGSSSVDRAGGKANITVSGQGTIEHSGWNAPDGWAATRPSDAQ